MVDLCLQKFGSCSRIMMDLSCMFSIHFIIPRRLELIWPSGPCNNVDKHGGCLCGLCLWWWMCW